MSINDYKQQWKNLSSKKNLRATSAIKAVEQDGFALQFVSEQTEAICVKAVEQDGFALRYVAEQTEAICIKAVEQKGYALRYVSEQMFETHCEELTLEQICIELGREIKIAK